MLKASFSVKKLLNAILRANSTTEKLFFLMNELFLECRDSFHEFELFCRKSFRA